MRSGSGFPDFEDAAAAAGPGLPSKLDEWQGIRTGSLEPHLRILSSFKSPNALSIAPTPSLNTFLGLA